MWVTVEGMFTFDFSSVESYADPDPPDAISDFDSIAEMVIRRSRIMNAYLAFFYTHQIEIDKHSQRRMVVTPEVMISATVVDGKIASQAFGNQRNSHLATSRFDRTYSSYIPHSMDSRINMRGLPISVAVVEAGATDLSDVIERHGENGIMLVDLHRASKAYQDHDHSLAVINYWAVIERLVNELWNVMIKEESITGQRRDRLDDSRTFSAAVMIETLALLSRIPSDIYEDITKIRQARNRWMHALKAVDADDSRIANNVCEFLLNQIKGLKVKGAGARWI